MDGLLVNPVTQSALEAYLKQPGAPVMLTGDDGSGKKYLARRLAAEALEVKQLADSPYCLEISRQEDKQDILIEQIRQIKQFIKLKTTGKNKLRRAIIILGAQAMNQEAQNALLKMLEEPAADTLFVLTAPAASSVLPTISSRTQIIELKPVGLKAAVSFFGAKASEAEIKQAWALSQGRVGLTAALLEQGGEHPLKISIDKAKSLLGMSKYERQLELDRLAKDRSEFKELLKALGLVLGALHRSAISKHNQPQAARLLKGRELVQQLDEYLEVNVSVKLAVSELTLNLNV